MGGGVGHGHGRFARGHQKEAAVAWVKAVAAEEPHFPLAAQAVAGKVVWVNGRESRANQPFDGFAQGGKLHG